MDKARFDQHLEAILDELPEEVQELIAEVPIIVEDEPSVEVLKEMGIQYQEGEQADLCGAHWGTPLSLRSVSEPLLEADRVLIFRGPIWRLAQEEENGEGSDAPPTDDELRHQILVTLLHELGHHFGMTEEDLEDLGYG